MNQAKNHCTFVTIYCFLLSILIHHVSTQSTQDDPLDKVNPQTLTRTKRTAMRGANHYYIYGIVPYTFRPRMSITQRHIIHRVMEDYQNLTCLRFVPRISRDGQWAKDLYNLGHNGYIQFVQDTRCYSGIGNNNGRTRVSCCGREKCIQQIGHALGLMHEYQNPNRDGFIDVNERRLTQSQKVRFMKALPDDALDMFPFDFSSPMGHSYSTSSNAQILLLTPDVSLERKDFYMFEEIVSIYQCRENNCSSFNMPCVNDGYITMIQGTCRCRCPERLNPETGCATLLSMDRSENRCGGIIELTDQTHTVNFTKHMNLTVECSWLVSAPPGDTIILDFVGFNISINTNTGDCDDAVKVYHSRLGQGGNIFCGTQAPRTIKSYFNQIMVVFLPSRRPRAVSDFNATVRLISARNLCYNPEDKGFTYSGEVNHTRDYTPCVEWWKVGHCPHNPYNFKDMAVSLNHNYCRNPGDGLMPWCYVAGPSCMRKYCDVCMLDEPVDKASNCARRIRWYYYCSIDKTEKRKTCAKTCESQLFSVQPSALSVTCSPPPGMSDSDQVDKLLQTSFTVGESVTFRCRHVNRLFRTEVKKYCLSSGGWTLGNTACLPCHLSKGYVLFEGSCYAIQLHRKTANQHERKCETVGGHLAYVRTVSEQEFVTDLGISVGVADLYIGPNDMFQENTFRFRDFSPVTWTNWDPSSRNGRRKDCVWTNSNRKWVIGRCGTRRHAVCKTPMLRHRRRGLADCSDSRDDCGDLLAKDEQMCQRGGGSFGVTQCPLTCEECI